jgi:hypothetical protein
MVAKVLDKFFLTQKIVAYVKDEGANLATCGFMQDLGHVKVI